MLREKEYIYEVIEDKDSKKYSLAELLSELINCADDYGFNVDCTLILNGKHYTVSWNLMSSVDWNYKKALDELLSL